MERETRNFRTKISAERKRQRERFGVTYHDNYQWLAILIEEVGEIGKCLNGDMQARELTSELVQVGAIVEEWNELITGGE